MADDRTNIALDKIEKLIVDGQKEVVEKILKVMEKGFSAIAGEFQEVKKDIKDMKFRLDVLDTSVRAAHYDIKLLETGQSAVRGDIKEVDRKLEAHIKVPHAA